MKRKKDTGKLSHLDKTFFEFLQDMRVIIFKNLKNIGVYERIDGGRE